MQSNDTDGKILSFAKFMSAKDKVDKLITRHKLLHCSSGALVGEGLVLTAAHSIKKNECAKICYKDTIFEAEVLVRLPKIDVMLLRFNDSKFLGKLPYLDFADTDVELGERLYSVGFPMPDLINLEPLFYDMQVTRLSIEKQPHTFQFNQVISPGCSGSALVNDRLQIVGVVTSRAQRVIVSDDQEALPNDWNYSTKTPYFIKSLQKYLLSPRQQPQFFPNTQTLAKRLSQSAVLVLACAPPVLSNLPKVLQPFTR